MAKWHRVKDKLPKKSNLYLVTWKDDKSRGTFIAGYDEKYKSFFSVSRLRIGIITHWRKWPKLPKD